MGNSAPVPPGDDDAPEGDDLDEAEMTSIMDAEQRRELQRVTRLAKEPERETARPPPEAVIVVEAEVVIPRAAAIPAEAVPAPESAPAPMRRPLRCRRARTSSTTWAVVAFVLLAAAIAFVLR
jgi:hypothetical protein